METIRIVIDRLVVVFGGLFMAESGFGFVLKILDLIGRGQIVKDLFSPEVVQFLAKPPVFVGSMALGIIILWLTSRPAVTSETPATFVDGKPTPQFQKAPILSRRKVFSLGIGGIFLGVVLALSFWGISVATKKPQVVHVSISGIAKTSSPFTLAKGKLSKLPAGVWPCSRSRSGYGSDGLETMRGGATLSRPAFLIEPRSFAIQTSSSNEYYDYLFEVTLTNRGEASIAKDWGLCLAHGKKASHYLPQVVSPSDLDGEIDISQATFSNTIEHGRAVRGWLRFRIPREETDPNHDLYGGIECRDYLEHKSAILFSSQDPVSSVMRQR